ncbi:MAG: hypothetical protein QM630_09910 [Microbacterium sp.]
MIEALLPVDPNDEIVSSTGIGVGLPIEAAVAEAALAPDGTVGYPALTAADASVAVISSPQNTRIHTIIPTADSPTEYSYPISDATPRLNDDGSVDLVGEIALWNGEGERVAQARILGKIGIPWAIDANGAPVSTHFEVRGNTVVQVAETTADTAFPVVADPDFWWWAGTVVGCAAEVSAFVVAWAKLPTIFAKATKIINARAKLSAAQRSAVTATVAFGASMLTDLLGIGTCASLVRAL